MTISVPMVVFADVDDLLWNPSPSSLRHASEVFRHLAVARIFLVLCSWKTRAELVSLYQEFGIRHPFVVEGGSAVFVPENHVTASMPGARGLASHQAVEFGKPYGEVVRTIKEVAAALGIAVTGLSDMSVEEVAREWDLSLPRARLAKLRDYAEPCLVRDATAFALNQFVRSLENRRLHVVARGRYHYVGAVRDAAAAMRLIVRLYRDSFGSIETLGIVEKSNGETLLRGLDHRVAIEHPSTAPETLDAGDWAEALLHLVADLRRGQSIARFQRQ